jgi:cytochrome P450
MTVPPLTVTTQDEAKEVYRHKDLRQALYDAGEVVMGGVVVNLHGEEHRARRRLENRLFRRETLVHYERDRFPAIIEETLAPYVSCGEAELVKLSHELMMNLAAFNAGIDRPVRTAEETQRLYSYMMKFIEGATLAHSTRNHDEVSREISEALQKFDSEFLGPSIKRRNELIAADDGSASNLPKDILTVLLKNEDSLHLPHELVRREIAFYLLAGAHTSATAFVRTLDNLFSWVEQQPDDKDRARSDPWFVQASVFETVRLQPSSPVGMRRATCDLTLKSGRTIAKDDLVTIDLMSINRDKSVYGADADVFNPHRKSTVEGVAPWGLSFGHGMHACIGQELAAGLLEHSEETRDYEFGLVTVAVQAMLDRRARRDPARPPRMDTTTKRPYWGEYRVLLGDSR